MELISTIEMIVLPTCVSAKSAWIAMNVRFSSFFHCFLAVANYWLFQLPILHVSSFFEANYSKYVMILWYWTLSHLPIKLSKFLPKTKTFPMGTWAATWSEKSHGGNPERPYPIIELRKMLLFHEESCSCPINHTGKIRKRQSPKKAHWWHTTKVVSDHIARQLSIWEQYDEE